MRNRNNVLSYLLLPLLSLSVSAHAAPAPSSAPTAEITVTQQVSPAGITRLDLNSVDAATLQRELNGIGKAKADAIVMHRDEHGPFASVDELLEIKGIGKALLDRNRDKLTVE